MSCCFVPSPYSPRSSCSGTSSRKIPRLFTFKQLAMTNVMFSFLLLTLRCRSPLSFFHQSVRHVLSEAKLRAVGRVSFRTSCLVFWVCPLFNYGTLDFVPRYLLTGAVSYRCVVQRVWRLTNSRHIWEAVADLLNEKGTLWILLGCALAILSELCWCLRNISKLSFIVKAAANFHSGNLLWS